MRHRERSVHVLTQAQLSPNDLALQNGLEPIFVLNGLGSVVLGMPKMKYRGGKPSLFVKHAVSDQPYRQIGVFVSPAIVGFVKAIDLFKIFSPDRKVACSGLLPARRSLLAPALSWHENQRKPAIAMPQP